MAAEPPLRAAEGWCQAVSDARARHLQTTRKGKAWFNRPAILPPTDTCPPQRGGTLLQGDGEVCTAYRGSRE